MIVGLLILLALSTRGDGLFKRSGRPSYYPYPAAATPAPAYLLVHLPPEARLVVDGNATESTEGTRVFVTPNLERGTDHHYTLYAWLVRDGLTFMTAKRVAVRAGEQTRVEMEFPVAQVAEK
jgi:uncharacterized protein (TIGR03000 family)